MLLAKPHRRSNRRRSIATAYAKANRIEKRPGKLHRKQKEEDENRYDDCPEFEGYTYDKEYYLASDKYASMVDNEIKELKVKKDWEEAMKFYNEDSKEEEDD
jgi:hypothetical protein|tara:strand:- start:2088 stop:2393 length:306 start_codon:yes stop_codon:yes gene_type:complete